MDFSIGTRIVISGPDSLTIRPNDGPFPIHGEIVGELLGVPGIYLIKRDDGTVGGWVNGEWCLIKTCSTLEEESAYLSFISGGTLPIITTDQHMAGISKEVIDQEKYDSFMKNLDCGYDPYVKDKDY